MSKRKLQIAIDSVNARYVKGLNDDDQVKSMIETDRKTKGYSFVARYDTYELCTDFEKLKSLCERYGYWSDEVLRFNGVLQTKGGYEYMTQLNGQYREKQRNS